MNANIIVFAILLTAIAIVGRTIVKQRLNEWHTYVIKKSKHFCQFTWSRLLLSSNSYLAFSVIFSTGANYDLGNEDQMDINKLYGLGFGAGFFRGPSYDSYRIGWRWNLLTEKIEVFLFVQQKGARWIDYLGAVSLAEMFSIRMMVENGKLFVYFYRTGQATKVSQYEFKQKLGWLFYRDLPYFGGNQTAPHDVKILIKEIY